MIRYTIGQALGLAVDVAREKARAALDAVGDTRVRDAAEAARDTSAENTRLLRAIGATSETTDEAVAMVVALRSERDAARAEVERLGDAMRAVMDERNEASRSRWKLAGVGLTLVSEANSARSRADFAEAVANEAMREGLAAVETGRQEVEFQRDRCDAAETSLRAACTEIGEIARAMGAPTNGGVPGVVRYAERLRAAVEAARAYRAAWCVLDPPARDVARAALVDALRALDPGGSVWHALTHTYPL